MNGRKVFGIALLIGALVCLVVGAEMYRVGGGSFAGLLGILMMTVGTGGFGLLGLLFYFRRGPLRSARQNIDQRSKWWWYRAFTPVAMVVGVLFGLGLIWLAASGVVNGEFEGRRGGSTVFREKPVAFLVQLLFYGGLGSLFLWGCGKTVLEWFVPPSNEDDDQDGKPSVVTRRGGGASPRASSRPGTK